MQKTKTLPILSLLLAGVLTLSACSPADLAGIETNFVSDEKVRENPLFWDVATAVPNQTDLYELHNESFTGKPYVSALRFGSNILLVGYASYSYEEDDEDAREGYEYSFDLYSPWRDSVTASVSHTDLYCDSYSVTANNQLICYDTAEEVFYVYDSALDRCGTFHLNGLGSQYDADFYYSGTENVYLTIDNSTGLLTEITVPGLYENDTDATTVKEVAVGAAENQPLYDVAIEDCADDGSYIVLSGINRETYQKNILFYSTASDSTAVAVTCTDYVAGYFQNDSYITRASIYRAFWRYRDPDGNVSYFYDENVYNYQMTDSGQILKRTLDQYEDGTVDLHLILYNNDGTVAKQLDYDNTLTENTDTFYPGEAVTFSEDGLVFFLEYNASCEPCLMVWDISDQSSSEDGALTLYPTREELEYAYLSDCDQADPGSVTLYTKIADADSYDWGDLSDVRDKADILEQTYGISIYIGPQVPDSIELFDIAEEDDPDTISDALDAFAKVLAAYPSNFFTQLCYGEIPELKFYFGGSISGDGDTPLEEAAAYVTGIEQYKVMVLDCNYCDQWDYTVNHEFSHMIDARLSFCAEKLPEDTLFSESGWNAYNPDDFSYLDSYEDYTENSSYDSYSDYFLDDYGTTFATEDRAELFGNAMLYYLDGQDDYLKEQLDDELIAKYSYYCDCIRDSFDTEGWTGTMPWETILN